MPLGRSSAGADRRGDIEWSWIIKWSCVTGGAVGSPECHRAGRGELAAKFHYAAQ
jgi:hypothetical protein